MSIVRQVRVGIAAVMVAAGLSALVACGSDDEDEAAPPPVSQPEPAPQDPAPEPDPDADPEPGPGGAPEPPPAGGDPGAPPAPAATVVSNCSGATFIFCEDFEALAPGPARDNDAWRIDPGNGVTAQVEALPDRDALRVVLPGGKVLGNQALHIRAPVGQGGFVRPRSFAPPAAGHFGRVWVYAEQFPTSPRDAHFVLVENVGTLNGQRMFVRPVGGQFEEGRSLFGIGNDGGPTGDWTDWMPSAPTTDRRWTCLEWQVQAQDNTVRMFIDGVEQTDLTVTTTLHNRRSGNPSIPFVLPRLESLAIGWIVFQGNTQPAVMDIWYDGMAVAAQRIGCL